MYLNVCLVTVSQCRFFSVLSKPFIVIEMVIIRTCDQLCLLVRSFYMLLVILAFFHLFCMLSCSVLMCMESIWWVLLRISKQTFQIQSKANSSTLYKIIKKYGQPKHNTSLRATYAWLTYTLSHHSEIIVCEQKQECFKNIFFKEMFKF